MENPSIQREFWHGEFVRALAISSHGNTVNFAMEDLAHAFKISFSHDSHKITAIEAEWVRHPVSSCIGPNSNYKPSSAAP